MSLAAPDVGLGMAIPDIDPTRIWCEQELVLLRRQMELVLGGKTGTVFQPQPNSVSLTPSAWNACQSREQLLERDPGSCPL